MKKFIISCVVLFMFSILLSFSESSVLSDSISMYIGEEISIVEVLNLKEESIIEDDIYFEKDRFTYFDIKENVIEAKRTGKGYVYIYKNSDPTYVKLLFVDVQSAVDDIIVFKNNFPVYSGENISLDYDVKYKNGIYRDGQIKVRSLSDNIEVINNKTIKTKGYGSSTIRISSVDSLIVKDINFEIYPNVKSIKIKNKDELSDLMVGERAKLDIEVISESDVENIYKIYSSDPSIIKVDGDSLIQAVKPGIAQIIIESIDGLRKDYIDVKSYSNIMGIKLDKDYIELTELNNEAKISASIAYRNLEVDTIIDGYRFYSLDESIASVDQNGNIRGHKNGITKIVVSTNDFAAKDYVSLLVNYKDLYSYEKVDVESVKINNIRNIIDVGEKVEINFSYEPSNATELEWYLEVKYDDIGEIIEEDGRYYYLPKKEGSNLITIYADSGVFSFYPIRSKSYLDSIDIDKSNLVKSGSFDYLIYLGQSIPLSLDYNAISGYYEDTILNRNVYANIVEEGIEFDEEKKIVTGKSIGKSKLVISSEDGDKFTQISFEVKSALKNISLDYKDTYNKGIILNIDPRFTFVSPKEYNLESNYKVSYETRIINEYINSEYVKLEINFEREILKFIQANNDIEDKLKSILLTKHKVRLDILEKVLKSDDGEYCKVDAGIYVTKRNGDRYRVAYIERDSIKLKERGKVDILIEEIGSSAYSVESIEIK